jgi:hypothetical protein
MSKIYFEGPEPNKAAFFWVILIDANDQVTGPFPTVESAILPGQYVFTMSGSAGQYAAFLGVFGAVIGETITPILSPELGDLLQLLGGVNFFWDGAGFTSPSSAADIWGYTGGDRALTGTQATNLAAIPNIPTTPLLANDSRIDAIKAKTDQLIFSGGDIVATLAGEEVIVTSASVNAIVAGINGSLTIPTAVQIRTEIDSNSVELAAIKAAANAAKALSAAGL